MSLNSASSIFTAIAFYFVYLETLSLRHTFGIVLIVMAAVFIGISKSGSTSPEVDASDDQISILLPMGLALLQSLFITMNLLLTKLLLKKGYSQIQLMVDFLFIQHAIVALLFIYEHFWITPYTWS
jgi:drug/metabolite transporter (DMT)-like permease